MRRSSLLLLLAVPLALPLAARADTVLLVNGQKYEDVIAESTPLGVRVRLNFGEITIPAAQVRAVEKSPSSLAEYEHRKAEIARRTTVKAADWVELARWAKTHGNSTGTREAALMAAELDPHAAGLDPLLRPLGLVYDDSAGRWIPYEESMARRGLVRYAGEWMSKEERAERLAADQRRRDAEAQQLASRRMADAAEAMARTSQQLALQQAQQQLAAQQAAQYPSDAYWASPYYYGGVVATFPGTYGRGGRGGHERHGDREGHGGHGAPPPVPFVRTPGAHDYGGFVSRVPGSLLPPLENPYGAPPGLLMSARPDGAH